MQNCLTFYFIQCHSGKRSASSLRIILTKILCIKIRSIKNGFSTDQYGPFHQIFQFTDIPRKGQTAEKLKCISRKFSTGQIISFSLAISKMTGK